MFCKYCGAALPKDAEICPNCSRPVSQPSVAQTEVPKSDANHNGQSEPLHYTNGASPVNFKEQNAHYRPESCNETLPPQHGADGYYGSQPYNPVNNQYNAPVGNEPYRRNGQGQYNSYNQNYNQNGGAFNPQTYRNPNEKASVGLCIVSVLFPIVGLILFLIQRDDTPRAAKSYIICAGVSFAVQIFFTIIFTLILWFATWAAVPYSDNFGDYGYDYSFEETSKLLSAAASALIKLFIK
ncbi:MAG: zinc ribbon domain-containing protein [Ruminococcus sp.]|nr:zinc ribbon domain-containing protein [Ruminococcus sp.]MDY3896303.1 zinc ribbon domain-containing protein [Candidatus Fimenecus sp.]